MSARISLYTYVYLLYIPRYIHPPILCSPETLHPLRVDDWLPCCHLTCPNQSSGTVLDGRYLRWAVSIHCSASSLPALFLYLRLDVSHTRSPAHPPTPPSLEDLGPRFPQSQLVRRTSTCSRLPLTSGSRPISPLRRLACCRCRCRCRCHCARAPVPRWPICSPAAGIRGPAGYIPLELSAYPTIHFPDQDPCRLL